MFEIALSSGTGCSSSNSFDTPVKFSSFGRGVATSTTGGLLDMEGPTTAPNAQGMGLIMAFTKTAGSLLLP